MSKNELDRYYAALRRSEMIGRTLVWCAIVAGLIGTGLCMGVACSAPAPAPKLAKAEGELCAARAAWKVFAAANNLAPAPGSERAKLEAAEDALCAVRAESNP